MTSIWVVGILDGAHYMFPYLKQAILEAAPKDVIIHFQTHLTKMPKFIICSLFPSSKDGTYEYKRYNCPRILLCGEPSNLQPFNDVQLIIDCKKTPSMYPKNVPVLYLPFFAWSFCERIQNNYMDLMKVKSFVQVDEQGLEKTKFCAFLYSQEVGFRNNLFHLISSYKQVDALGKACNSDLNQSFDRRQYNLQEKTYNDTAVEKYKPYKFVIACENSRHEGYVTEKMISPLLANCIPIYLGAYDVTNYFNPEAFINVADYDTPEKLIERITFIDTNEAEYLKMVNQPIFHTVPDWFKPEYLSQEYGSKIISISSSSLSSSSMKPQHSSSIPSSSSSSSSFASSRTIQVPTNVNNNEIKIPNLNIQQSSIRRAQTLQKAQVNNPMNSRLRQSIPVTSNAVTGHVFNSRVSLTNQNNRYIGGNVGGKR